MPGQRVMNKVGGSSGMLLGEAKEPAARSWAFFSECTASTAQNYGPTALTNRHYPAWHPAARPWPQPTSRSPLTPARSAAASLPAEQVLERVVSTEQAEADLAAIRNMWELATVYEFLSTFKYWLNFTQLYPLHDLEEAIVKSPGPGVSCCPTQPPAPHYLLDACCLLVACHHPPPLMRPPLARSS